MKAAQISSYGTASIIRLNEIPRPSPSEKQVLIKVHAASINPFDTTVREGRATKLELPLTLGGDLVGTVMDSNGAANIQNGDRVYGQANVVAGNSGAFAEFAVTGADQVAQAPATTTDVEAASLPLVGVSALQAITEHLDLQKGQKIFIHGGAGGIGTIAIQIAKHRGAYVAVTATSSGIGYTKQLGADEVIDYTITNFADVLHDFDAVFDTVGGDDFAQTFLILKPGGKAVTMIADVNQSLAKERGITATRQATRITTVALRQLARLVDQGRVKPYIEAVYPLEKIQDAFEARESRTVRGKIAIEIG